MRQLGIRSERFSSAYASVRSGYIVLQHEGKTASFEGSIAVLGAQKLADIVLGWHILDSASFVLNLM